MKPHLKQDLEGAQQSWPWEVGDNIRRKDICPWCGAEWAAGTVLPADPADVLAYLEQREAHNRGCEYVQSLRR